MKNPIFLVAFLISSLTATSAAGCHIGSVKALGTGVKFTVTQTSGACRSSDKTAPPRIIAGVPSAFELSGTNVDTDRDQKWSLLSFEAHPKEGHEAPVKGRIRQLQPENYFVDDMIFPRSGEWILKAAIRTKTNESLTVNFPLDVGQPPNLNSEVIEKNIVVSPFSLTNQDGVVIKSNSFSGKVWLVNFFFATCTMVCPQMNAKMAAIQRQFADNPEFLSVSITTDPEKDTPAVLKEYAKRYKANPKSWMFLTGDKKKIVEIAKGSFAMPAQEDSPAHTTNFYLINPQGELVGTFETTSASAVAAMRTAIEKLLSQKR